MIAPPDEAELHAWVDGRLAPDRHAQIADWLKQHPDAMERVTGWQRDTAALRAALATTALPANPMLDPVQLRRRSHARTRTRFAMAASLVLALLLGGSGGWLLRDASEPDWIPMANAISAYRLFAASDAPGGADAPLQPLSRDWLLTHFGTAGTIPDLSAQGLTLQAVRLLATPEGPAAMLVYEDADGGRLGLYLRSRSPRLQRPGERRDGQLLAKYWSEKNVSIAVVGPADDQVRRVASVVQQAG